MNKAFRWLCGELNGDFFRFMQETANYIITPYVDELAKKKSMVFKLEEEDIHGNEYPISSEDLHGIAKIAGVFPPFITAESNLGSLVGSSSHIVGGVEYSDRGLFNMDEERFNYVRTDQNTYYSDITTIATERLRSSLVPEGAPILGYIADGTVVFNEDGSLIPEAITAEPPVDKAYIAFYGEKYLFASETFIISDVVNDATYKKIYESLMRIRSSHPNISELSFLTVTIAEDYLTELSIERSGNRFILHYVLNDSSTVTDKIRRLAVWKSIIQKKYKLITFQEDGGL